MIQQQISHELKIKIDCYSSSGTMSNKDRFGTTADIFIYLYKFDEQVMEYTLNGLTCTANSPIHYVTLDVDGYATWMKMKIDNSEDAFFVDSITIFEDGTELAKYEQNTCFSDDNTDKPDWSAVPCVVETMYNIPNDLVKWWW